MLIVVLSTAQMLVGEIIGNTVTGSLALVTNVADVDASRKSTQMRASRRNAHKANFFPADQIAPWPLGTLAMHSSP